MKTQTRILLSVGLLGLATTALAGTFLHPHVVHETKASETSADWNNPASATSSDYGTYYNGITGTSGMTLKDQLTDLIDGHTVVSYDGLYDLYKTSDNRPEDNTVFDMYGDFHFSHSKTCGNYKNEGDCFNREHSVPKSWFNEKSPMYSDAFHLYPTDGKVNGMRSNYAFGEVSSASYSYTFKNDITGVSKKGNSKRSGYSGVVFEPADCYKGDFARTYFYFATRYKDIMGTMSGDGQVHFTSSTTYCNLTEYSKDLFLDWHRADPVSKKEIVRNNAVYAKQKNRNPFIDHPEYVEAIWGDTPIGAGSVSLSQSTLSMEYGSDGAQLTASSSDNSQITWTTSSSTVATINPTTSNSGAAVTIVPHAVGSATITATATIKGTNYSASCAVNVTKVLSSLVCTGTLKKTEYIDGDTFDSTGLTVTATYTDNTNEDVTNKVTWTPNPLTEGTTSVTGTYSTETVTVNGITVAHNDNPTSGTYVIDASSSTQITSSSDETVVFTESIVSVTMGRNGSSNTKVSNYLAKSGHTRIYSGNTFTVSAGGAAISSITIGYHSEKSLNGFKNGNWTNKKSLTEEDDSDIVVIPTTVTSNVVCTIATTSSFSGVTVVVGSGGDPTPTKTLESIYSTGQTTEFTVGSVFAYDGVCKAVYSDESESVITPVVDSSDVNMSIPDTYTVSLSYAEGGVTVEDCYDITVVPKEDSGTTVVNSIKAIYEDISISAAEATNKPSVSNVYGLYVGSYKSGSNSTNNAIIMNGEYGIDLYGYAATGWVENETYVKITSAKVTAYNKLYELTNVTATTITDVTTINENVEPVVTYAVTGAEGQSDYYLENRLSLMSGTITGYKNDTFTQGSDNTVYLDVGGKSITLFVKSAEATSDVKTAFDTAKSASKEITVQGYSCYYQTTFEIQFKQIIEPDTSYTAEDFAQDLINLTNGACTYSFNHGYSNVYSTLAPIWVTLEGADYYAKLPADQKLILKNYVAVEGGTTLQDAMARYDYICAKYTSLTNFINRDVPYSSNRFTVINNSTLLVATVVATITVVSALGFALFLKKKKHQ